MGKILVIGSLNMDTVSFVDSFPQEGETVLAEGMQYIPGGKGANQAYAAAKLGGDVTMIGAVGNDDNGRKLLANLKSVGVDTHAIKIVDVPTGCAFVSVNRQGNNNIVVNPSANHVLVPPMLDGLVDIFDDCYVVLMQLEIPIPTVCHAARLAKERGKLVILDPAPAEKDLPPQLYQSVDIITPNETELSKLTGLPSETTEQIEAAARILLKRGVGTVITTAGKKGAVVTTSETSEVYPVRDVPVVDTTGAGDSFTAALAYMLTKKISIEEAVSVANAVSTVVVTRKGAQSSIPTMDEVQSSEKGGLLLNL